MISVFLFRRLLLCTAAALCVSGLHAQEKKPLTVEWIYSREASAVTATPAVQWLDDGRAVLFDRQRPPEARSLEILDPVTLKRSTLLRGQEVLDAMRKVLGEEKTPRALSYPQEISRNGTRGMYLLEGDIYLLDFTPLSFVRITSTPEEEKCAMFSPDGYSISFVRTNNLYVYDIRSRRERQLTTDGSDSLLNGTLSWVYWEEVFGRRDIGYWWSEDSKSIAYFQTDESGVSVQYFPDFKPWTPRVIRQRYPKIGERNPTVRLGIIELAGGRTRWADLASTSHEYVVRAKWLPDNRHISVQTMNRKQTELDLLFVDAQTGLAKHILTERDSGWVNIVDDLYFLRDGTHFLWSSERTGFKHLYLYAMDGTLVRALTSGNWALRASGGLAWVDQSVVAIDEADGWIYFTALEKSSIEHHLYRVRTDGTGFQRLSNEDGTHTITFSPNGKFYFDRYSNVTTQPDLKLFTSASQEKLALALPRTEALAGFDLRFPAFFSIRARDGFALPAQILKPKDFDPSKKYPVIFYVYGGPSAPQVTNVWQRDVLWENILVQNGYLVMHVDPRSATGISKTLENLAACHLMGDVELNDLVDAARWVKSQPYVDSSRIGLWGWSGGGTYTMVGMTRSKEFKAGIAVAGVSDMRFYDTKFGEAIMKTENDNLAGFEHVSLLKDAKNISGRLMIVHGTYDDNVHIQNAWAFIDELIKANKRFDLMVYPMRMHGISDMPARVHLFTTMLEFWKRNL